MHERCAIKVVVTVMLEWGTVPTVPHGLIMSVLQEYGYVYNVRRYGRSISSTAPHPARGDQLDADTGITHTLTKLLNI